MFEIIFKIWYTIAILPLYLAIEGYDKLKKYMIKRGHPWDWSYNLYIVLVILIILLIILLMLGYR